MIARLLRLTALFDRLCENMNNTDKGTFVDEMFKVGAHFGYSKSRRHPSVKSFIFGVKNRVEIMDLEKTEEALSAAKEFARSLAQEGKQMLFVGTKPEAKKWIMEGAQSIDMPFVTEHWVGGTMTNFSQIKKRIDRFHSILDKKEKGELAMYTKKERLLLDREMEKLDRNFGGIIAMKQLPKALFVIDPRAEHNAVIEAQKENIPIVALASSDCDISNIDYPIPANDSASASIRLFVDEIAAAYKEGRNAGQIKDAKKDNSSEASLKQVSGDID